jgi:hypothetical protein
MLFNGSKLDTNSFMILLVISILVSSAKKCQFDGSFIADISVNIITKSIRSDSGPRMDACGTPC